MECHRQNESYIKADKPNNLKFKVYKHYVRPSLTYGSEMWKWTKDKGGKVAPKNARIILGIK